jgi:membrane fusion protein (multidrug efflux system)
MDLYEHVSGSARNPTPSSAELDATPSRQSQQPQDRESILEQIGQLRRELERLRDQQTVLQRNPPPFDPGIDQPGVEGIDNPEAKDGTAGSARRRLARLVGALIAAMLLSAAGLRLWNYMASYQWTDDAEIDGHLDPISTRIDGTVVRVYVENTYHVRKGQPLVDLDPRDYQVALENARANLAQAQQAVKAAQRNYDLSVANLDAAVATNAKAQLDVKRYAELFKEQVVAREAWDEIIRIGRVDTAGVNSARAAVAAAQRMIGQAEAAVQAAQASLDQATLNLSYTHIVAPADGVVGDKTVQVGQRVQPGEQLLTVVPLDDIWITADFRETQLRRMKPGQPVTVHVDSTGRNYRGYVEGMPGATGELFSLLPPENATGNYVKVVQRLPVRIRLYPGEDPDHRLRPGMSVEPTVWVEGAPRSLW